ncbi:membrane progestin receptor beta-like [Betta splendens]|uniref:Membrane progestin receptor beta-like n=1 Tax=Betta splendens TaxID=158456 RepID=A0A6P7M0S7_BETSP|nr:membrane progestin receptor beta-like [Betta splendens]
MPRVSLSPPPLTLTLLPLLDQLLPSLPATVRDADVPPLLRRRFVLSGYRPLGLSWRCCVLSLFQIHNETVNAWSHLLAAACLLMRFLAFAVLQGGGILGFRLQGPEGQGFSVDVSSLPLVLYVFSTVTWLSCSAAAHLLQSHSEQTHRALFLLGYVGVGVYQYGGALALWLYSSDGAWTQSMLGQVFLPAAALLAWFSCSVLCHAKLQSAHRKFCHAVPLACSCLLGISPVAHRLTAHRWSTPSVLVLHFLQVVLLLLSAAFFACPVPERFSPGSYDVIGHSHQLFHVLSSICTLVQQEALFQDFLWRRPGLVRELGGRRLLLACASFPCLALSCLTTALAMMRKARARLKTEQR